MAPFDLILFCVKPIFIALTIPGKKKDKIWTKVNIEPLHNYPPNFFLLGRPFNILEYLNF